jgi:hypothetical protein
MVSAKLLAIVLGALGSFAWSFMLAALVLRLRHWRNEFLLGRGEPPYKDCVFPRPLWFMATFFGVATIIPVGLFVSSSPTSIALAALVPPSTLALLPILGVVSQARR